MKKYFYIKKSLLLGFVFLSFFVLFNNPQKAKALGSFLSSSSYVQSSSINSAVLANQATPLSSISVTTDPIPSAGLYSATIKGTYNITPSSSGNHTYFNWGSTPSYGNQTTYTLDDNSSDTFTETLSGLTPGATYFIQACVVSPAYGISCGNQVNFTTNSLNPLGGVSTMSSSNITQTSATLVGFFKGDSSSPIQTKFFWGTSSTGLTNSTSFVLQGSTSGSFSADITGLSPNTTYYFKADAMNSFNEVTAKQTLSFTTLPATVTACNLSNFWTNYPSNTINSGFSAVLYWTPSSGCSSITLTSSDGNYSNYDVTTLSSLNTGNLYSPISYTLKGKDSAGNVTTLYLTVNVTSGGTTGSTCTISQFYMNGSTYATVSSGSTVTMSWNTSSGCTNIYITGTNGAYFGSEPTSYSATIGPLYSNTTYTIYASDSYGVHQQATATVNVTSVGGGYNYSCSISSFYPSNYNIVAGQTVTLTWTATPGCTNVTLSSSNNGLPYYSYNLPVNGSLQTNPLYGTTTFNISANGNVSVTGPSTTVYVTGGYYPYQQNNNGSTSVITTVPTNVSAYSARINAILVGTGSPATAYFEYGTTSNLGLKTNQQNLSSGQTMVFSDTIYTTPETTYYYRGVVQINGITYNGDLMTVITKSVNDNNTVYTTTDTTTDTTSNPTATTTTGVSLSLTNKTDKVYVGDTVDYTLNYTNNTGKVLKNAHLNIIFPQGFTVLQTTKGQMTPPSVINADLGTLDVGQSGSIFMQANVGSNVSLTSTLVTNATLYFTYPNKVSDSTVGYVLNHAGGISSLGGFSLGAGFFPTTALGWIITILIILAIILTIRRISKAQNAQASGQIHH